MTEVREPTNEDVLVWAVPVGNIPTNFFEWIFTKKGTKKAMQLIMMQTGFLGFYPNKPFGTMCLFDSENNAKGAKNILLFHGGKAGNIVTCYISRGEISEKGKI